MIVGIDLGTSNSLVGYFTDDGVELVENVFEEVLTPSVVGIADDGDVLVGRTAADRLVTHPERTVGAFKRFMGSNRQITLGRQSFRPEELSALVLRSLCDDVAAKTGQRPERAVISVPAYFNDTQRKATIAAGGIAGLQVERLVNEPTAAALAYGLHQLDGEGESTFLVFDVGGGTFDVSVLELFDGVMEVHASAGDNFLGGEDFVDVLVAMFVENAEGLQLTPSEMAALRTSAERAKRTLNSKESATLRVVRGDEELTHDVTRASYETRVAPLLERLRRPVQRALRDSRLRVDDLDQVVLVGGSTRKILIQRLVAQMFGKLPLRHIDPDEVVARGAAVQAALVDRHAALEDVVMTDVCPYTLGVEVVSEQGGVYLDGLFSPILERNTIVPASREERYFPVEDRQKVLELKVYQGESRRVADNVLLGKLKVKLPRLTTAESAVDVRFSYDTSGILEVEATVVKTQVVERLVISQNAGTMSNAEQARALERLAGLKIHPRDQAPNVATMNRALRLYQELIGAEREHVGRLIDHFSALLSRQDPLEIRAFRQELQAWLDEFEAQMGI